MGQAMIVREIKCDEFVTTMQEQTSGHPPRSSGSFTVAGLEALYDYLNECSGYDSEPYTFDAAKTAGEFSEQTPAQVCERAWHLLDSDDRERVHDGDADTVAAEFLFGSYSDAIIIEASNGHYIIGE